MKKDKGILPLVHEFEIGFGPLTSFEITLIGK